MRNRNRTFLSTARDATTHSQTVLQGVPVMGVQVLRERRLILLHEKRVRRTATVKQNCPPPPSAAPRSTLWHIGTLASEQPSEPKTRIARTSPCTKRNGAELLPPCPLLSLRREDLLLSYFGGWSAYASTLPGDCLHERTRTIIAIIECCLRKEGSFNNPCPR